MRRFNAEAAPAVARQKGEEMDLIDSVEIGADNLVLACHGAAKASGWWTNLKTGEDLTQTGNFNVAEKLCLIHSEISEAMEGHRKNLPDDKLPHRPMIEVELADALIRIADLAGAMGLDLGGAVVEKLAYNANRADHQIANRIASGGKAY